MKAACRVVVLGTFSFLLLAAPASAEFSIAEFTASTTSSQAGAHPDVTASVVFPTITGPGGTVLSDGSVRSVEVGMPPGLQGTPNVLPRCSEIEFKRGGCRADAQVGWVELHLSRVDGTPMEPVGLPVFSLEPLNSEATAEIGFSVPGAVTAHLPISVRSDGNYGLTVVTAGISRALYVDAFSLTIWGVPGDPSHDPQRLDMNTQEPRELGPLPRIPFFTNPTSCGGELTLHAEATSYEDPDKVVEADTTLPPVTGCSGIEFAPKLRARPTTDVADSPSGLDLDLAIPQNLDPDGLASAQLRDVTLTLPEGLVVNPPMANGLQACSPQQIGLTTAVGDPLAHFGLQPPSCPAASSLGTVEVVTPLVTELLKGRVYLATPQQNPFGTLLAIYLSIQGPGIDIKLPAKFEADPQSGRITINFGESPQLPVEHLRLHLFKGALAPLRTPAACGTYATASSLVPWSAPESGPPATPKDEYAIDRAPDGGGCARSEAELPGSASFEAGSTAPLAGAFRPFVVNLSREDGTQQFGALTMTLPPGLLAKVAGTESCPELALALATSRSGRSEEGSPSCPAGSRVGQVFVGAGSGPDPYTLIGSAYLAGPYKGAPFSLAVVVPAVAGPFDLGTVVVRTALYLDSRTARITAKSDPIPSILQGIPLDVRSVSLRLDRPEFTVTPTSCDPGSVAGSLLTTSGATASLADHFQVGDCRRLGFKPRSALEARGSLARNAHPGLRIVLRPPRHQANLAAATIGLPPGFLLDLRHIGALCPSGLAPEQCPPASRLGRATVWSPLLDAPLRGPIYLRRPTGRYPDLLADLHGPYGLSFSLRGAFQAASGRVSVRFSNLPDIPVGKAVLAIAGGSRGMLVNSRSLCAHPRRGLVALVAQDARRQLQRPKLTLGNRC